MSVNNKLKLLFIAGKYSPTPGGSGVVMKNLIESLPKDEVVGVITRDTKHLRGIEETGNGIPLQKINREQDILMERGVYFVNRIFFKRNLNKIIKIIKKLKPSHIVGVYPSADFLLLSHTASKRFDIPFIPYLHDTIEEGTQHSRYRKLGANLERRIFNNCNKIFVMSDGMKDLYLRKYNKETFPLRHSCFPIKEGKDRDNNEYKNDLFWGGIIYGINSNAVKRVSEACADLNMRFTINTSQDINTLKKIGIEGSHININNVYLTNNEYITSLKSHGILLIALDFSEESIVHENELSTIFPTKVIEYLHSGRPILVHAPENYFISKFMSQHNCGYVVSDKSPNSIANAIKNIYENEKMTHELTKNALKVSVLFNIERIKDSFYEVLNK